MQTKRTSPFDEPDQSPDFVRGDVVEISTVQDALRLLDQWEAAYAELKREYIQLHHRFSNAIFWAAVYKTGEKSNWTLYRAALEGDDELRTALLAQITEN